MASDGRQRTRLAASSVREPLPLLLVRRGPVNVRLLGALTEDTRVELFSTDDLSPEWLGFADRTSGIIVATMDEPLSGLLYALTAGVRVPIVVAAQAQYRSHFGEVAGAGGAGCVAMPIRVGDMDRVLDLVGGRRLTSTVDAESRLLLDPVARVVRFRDRCVRLTQREFALLHCLSGRHGRAVSCDALYRYVWGDSAGPGQSQQIVAVYVCQLRRKLARLGLGDVIATVRGFGYALAQATGSVAP